MFAIPMDMIAARAADTLYTATRNKQDGADGATMENSPESTEPVAALDAEALTDPADTIEIKNCSYLEILADAQ